MKIKEIDSFLLKIRLPIESSRTTRSLTERAKFKANEWRNLAFYMVVPIFEMFLPAKFLNNLAKYVIF